MKRLILASQSPRRKQLLEMLGISFEVIPSTYVETTSIDADAKILVGYLSFQKAQDVASKHSNAIVIGADTVVALKDKVLGKPKNTKHAKEMLSLLSGKTHEVVTGYTIIDTTNQMKLTNVITSKVYFKKLKPKEIESYVASGEPMDKAGAYGVQGLGSIFVRRIEGDYFNIVGLPIKALAEDLSKFGISIL